VRPVTGDGVAPIIREVFPYLCVRGADAAIAFWTTWTGSPPGP
jgi:hypothetical protein